MNSWVGHQSSRTFWNLDPSSEVICIRAGCANGKMEPKCSKCHSTLTYLYRIAARGIPQPLRDQECSVLRLGSDMTQIYLLLLRQSVQLITLVSPLKYKPHRSSLTLSATGFLCFLLITPLALPVPLRLVHCVHWNSSAPSLTNSPGYHHFSTI